MEDSGGTDETAGPRVSDVGEAAIVAGLASTFTWDSPVLAEARAGSTVVVGIGDDAAVLRSSPSRLLVWTTDALVEDVHFRREWAARDARWLGRKSVAINLSDIAAMGGEPRYLLLALSLPPDLPLSVVYGIADGVAERARALDVSVLGGNVTGSGGPLSISVSALGECDAPPVRRSGARPGDRLLLTGVLGAAAIGLALLEEGEPARWEGAGGDERGRFLRAQLDPEPRVREGQLLARYASAMIDLSDGLVVDLERVCNASGCGARVDLASLPALPETAAWSERLFGDAHHAALVGGEDYELLAAVAAARQAALAADARDHGVRLTDVGEITADRGILLSGPAGLEPAAQLRGFDHFRGPRR